MFMEWKESTKKTEYYFDFQINLINFNKPKTI